MSKYFHVDMHVDIEEPAWLKFGRMIDNDNNNDSIQRRNLNTSPHCAANCLQQLHSSGHGAIVCKSHATHRVLITFNTSCYVPHGTMGQLDY